MASKPAARISFGIRIPRGFVFPWSEVKSKGKAVKARPEMDPEDWWLEQNKYKAPHKVWDEKGEKIEGVSDAQVDECYDHKQLFLEKIPFPAEVVTMYSHNGDRVILAAKGSIHESDSEQGSTLSIELDNVKSSITEQAKADLRYLVKQSFLPLSREQGVSLEEPGWILSSYVS